MMTRGSILLTGATGFVGGELLARLLTHDSRPVICPVRAADDEEARRRGQGALSLLFSASPEQSWADRVHWICGDVERRRLGWSESRFRDVACRVDEIFHCAASTQFDLPFDQARRINECGTREVYGIAREAARSGRFQRLHHVSTAYASGVRRGRISADDLPVDHPRGFRNSYERSKARAERFLREQRDVPYTIYRPSIVVGDSRNGRTTNWNVVYFPMRLMALGRLPIVPAGGLSFLDCVPVDFVADAIFTLARRIDTTWRTLHLTAGSAAMTVADVIRQTYEGIARRRGQPIYVATKTIPTPYWRLLRRGYGMLLGRAARRTIAKFQSYEPYTRIAAVYDNHVELALLADGGVRFPSPSDFFPRIVDYALQNDFGRGKSVVAADPAVTDSASARVAAAGVGP